MKKLFPSNSLTTIYRREKNLKEMLSPSLFTPKFNKNESSPHIYLQVQLIVSVQSDVNLEGRLWQREK